MKKHIICLLLFIMLFSYNQIITANHSSSHSKINQNPSRIKSPSLNTLYYPSASISVESGSGVGGGRWGIFIGGVDCHYGNCKVDGQAGFVVGFGNASKYVEIDLIPRLSSIGWHDDGFGDRGTLSFKITHSFNKVAISTAVGAYEAMGYSSYPQDIQKSYYFAVTKTVFIKTKNGTPHILLLTAGIGNGYYAIGPVFNYVKLKKAHSKIKPYFAIGYQLNSYLGITANQYNTGIIDMGLTIQPILKWKMKILLGAGDIFTYNKAQSRPSFIGSVYFFT